MIHIPDFLDNAPAFAFFDHDRKKYKAFHELKA
jgi:hypothetical protein